MRKLFRNKFTYIIALALVCAMSLAACGNKNAKAETESKKAVQDATESTKKAEKTEKIALSDGTYTAEFTTDSSMFHVNDAYDNKGTLTVKDGKATIHVALTSTHIVNLFLGTAKDASKDKAELLEPTVETVQQDGGIFPYSPGIELCEADVCIDVQVGKVFYGSFGNMLVAHRIVDISLSYHRKQLFRTILGYLLDINRVCYFFHQIVYA